MIIHKYKLDDEVELPVGFELLSCQMQDDVLHLWALVDPTVEETTKVRFKIVGTGNEFNSEGLQYISTVQTSPFAWHVWRYV